MARWSYLILTVHVLLAVNVVITTTVTAQEVTETTTKPTVPTTTTTVDTTTKTTTKSTSTSTTAATTTAANTTTTAAPTTTSAPTPAPTTQAPKVPDYPNNIGNWFVNETGSSNKSCLALSSAFEIVIKSENSTEKVDIRDATANGTCSSATATINLYWQQGTLKLTFTRNETAKKSALSGISLSVKNAKGDIITPTDLTGQTYFETPENKSYKCVKDTSIKIDENIQLKVANLQVEAFRQTPYDKFSSALECSSDDVSPVVPLAVGISLAVLVVIVLIAYLIGRSRSRARGYQSV